MNTDRTHHPISRAPRLAAAALLCLGTVALAPAAHAEPGKGQGQGQTQPPGQAQAPGQAQSPATPTPAPAPAPQGNGNGNGHGQANGNSGQGQANGHGNNGQSNGHGNNGQSNGHGNNGQSNGHGNNGQGGGHGNSGQGGGPSATHDPAGNNGTVKIAPLGDVDGIPDNTPHVGCTFLVEWYGFDEGADIISTVSFAEHAPTTGVGMTVSGPSQVFVGEDPASGAGTSTGLDARQPYTLSFTGVPHPKQGYHVKLTIHTPGSIGNDTKSKVFWVEGCKTTTPEAPTTPETPNTPNSPNTPGAPEVLPGTGTSEQAPEVLGEQAFAADVTTQAQSEVQPQAAPSQQELPTSVNAGEAGDRDFGPVSRTTALLGLLLVLLGAVSARLGWIRARG